MTSRGDDPRIERLRVRAGRLRVRLVQDQRVGSPTFGLWNIVPSHEFDPEAAMTLDEVEAELEVRGGAKRRSGESPTSDLPGVPGGPPLF